MTYNATLSACSSVSDFRHPFISVERFAEFLRTLPFDEC